MFKRKPKYELTDQTIEFDGYTLYRIRALRDFSLRFVDVEEGDLGGYVSSEDNLSQTDFCWISHHAKAFEAARVSRDAWLHGRACLYGHVGVGGNADVRGDAHVSGQAYVGGNAKVGYLTKVNGNARLAGDVKVFGNVHITTGHFTSGYFRDQDEVEAYLASLETKEQTHDQA